jgi:Protein of unknown function (DUF2892)
MMKNVGSADRVGRALGGVAMLVCSVMAPLPLLVRVTALGGMGSYLLFTAVAGTCLGYRLMGKSTCPVESAR